MMPLGHLGLPLIPFIGRQVDRHAPWLLMLGSVLPDLVDKPLGHYILPLDNGRIFAHTLLFAIILLGASLFWRKLMPLSMGVSFHQLLDGMFLDPGTALWPILGPFPEADFELSYWLDAFTETEVILGELMGALALSLFLIIRYGHILRPARQR